MNYLLRTNNCSATNQDLKPIEREKSDDEMKADFYLEFKRLNARTLGSNDDLRHLFESYFSEHCHLLFNDTVRDRLLDRLWYRLLLVYFLLINLATFILKRWPSLQRQERLRDFELVFHQLELIAFNWHLIVYALNVAEFIVFKFRLASQTIQLHSESISLDKLDLDCDIFFKRLKDYATVAYNENDESRIRCFVALSNKKPIGILLFRLIKMRSSSNEMTIAELSTIYVLEKYRRLSIGTHLMNSGLFHCKLNRIENIVVVVPCVYKKYVDFFCRLNATRFTRRMVDLINEHSIQKTFLSFGVYLKLTNSKFQSIDLSHLCDQNEKSRIQIYLIRFLVLLKNLLYLNDQTNSMPLQIDLETFY